MLSQGKGHARSCLPYQKKMELLKEEFFLSKAQGEGSSAQQELVNEPVNVLNMCRRHFYFSIILPRNIIFFQKSCFKKCLSMTSSTHSQNFSQIRQSGA